MTKACGTVIIALVLTFGLLVLLGGPMAPVAHGATSQTGQGIMVNLHVPDDLAFNALDAYLFSRVQASAFFSNAWDGNDPVVTCTPVLSLGCLLFPANTAAPPAPPAPAPLIRWPPGSSSSSSTVMPPCR
jgi:hypothetical protein